MRGRDFLNSKWMNMARKPGAAKDLVNQLARWLPRVRNSQLVERAQQMLGYFRSAAVPRADKLILLAALLYLISPFDAVPDFIPFAGFLDDLGVATFALNYVMKKLDPEKEIDGTEPPLQPG